MIRVSGGATRQEDDTAQDRSVTAYETLTVQLIEFLAEQIKQSMAVSKNLVELVFNLYSRF
jgi:hypothetical protein